MLSVAVQVMERNRCVQKCRNSHEVYLATGSEEVQRKFVWIVSDDQR